ncbi:MULTISPECIES: hypothetical protein [unclassified Polynucleobacter]|uniref:hypothetical protein n=1 Tax=unclassified Polynucleobacter TaxID=2640945 RepID=UPI001C0DC18D|nr:MULTISPECIES: hypothetical protein [unclassified Polynucleobacter]MBU3562396.1 hypothetical protein [Polynucleobacter sp. Tro8-14-1]MBU3641897.1 hypothetical protein [Polynucleobacter sp. Fuers-14]
MTGRNQATLLISAGLLLLSSTLLCGTSLAQSADSQPVFQKSVSNLRNQRYCEVLVGKRAWLNLEVKVFNTQGLNLCPEAQWKTLTKESIEKSFDASFVLLNGPRYWTMDEIQAAGTTVNDVKESFGGIEMNLRATVQVSLLKQLMGSKQYSPNEVTRTTNFVYRAGSAVYELTSPAGEVYVMQSYSQIVNPALSMKDLPVLSEQLKLPAGWTYRSRVLDQDLSLVVNGIAYVLQDNLLNSYQRR